MDTPEDRAQQQAQQAILYYQQLANSSPLTPMRSFNQTQPILPQQPYIQRNAHTSPNRTPGPCLTGTLPNNLQGRHSSLGGTPNYDLSPNQSYPNNSGQLGTPGSLATGPAGIMDLEALQKQQQQLMMTLMQSMVPSPNPTPISANLYAPTTNMQLPSSGSRLESIAPKTVTPIAMKTPGMTAPAAHIAAEQKRRNNIKVGFQDLQGMLPSYKAKGPAQKLSISAILFQALDYINMLQQQKNDLTIEVAKLQNESLSLKAINMKFQQVAAMQQPGMGAIPYETNPYETNRLDSPEQAKFLLFKTFVSKLYGTFEEGVCMDSMEGLQASVYQWLDTHVETEELQHIAL
eukprot:Ihof_evm2s519 gene=Ihof_evmTU2s519